MKNLSSTSAAALLERYIMVAVSHKENVTRDPKPTVFYDL